MANNPFESRQLSLFKAIAEFSRTVIGAKDLDGRYIYVNAEYSRLFHLPSEGFLGKTDDEIFPPEIAAGFQNADRLAQKANDGVTVEEDAPVDGKIRRYLSVKFPIRDESGALWATGVIATDITERKEAEDERKRLIEDLRKALAKIDTLTGLLPICASCKRIRNDGGYWEQIENFIREHSSAEFSHCLCPECAEKLYPGIFPRKEKK